MQNSTTLDDMIIQYSENPFVDEPGFNRHIATDQVKKVSILNRLLYMANLLSQNKMEEIRQTIRMIPSRKR